jgi:hypothetical protein
VTSRALVQASIELGTQAEVEEVQRVFNELNLEAQVKSFSGVYGIEVSIPWAVILTVPLVPFFNSFMSKAGEDGYLLFKKLIGRLYRSGKRSEIRADLSLNDPEADITIVLRPDLPDAAYAKLIDIDPEHVHLSVSRVLWWNPKVNDWTTPWPLTKDNPPGPYSTLRRSDLP